METKNKEGNPTDYTFKNKRYYAHYSEREMYDLWKEALGWIGEDEKVFEIGCGTGQFGHMVVDSGREYKGIDFSPTAISVSNKLREDNNLKAEFVLADARDGDNYSSDYDVFVCFSTLEHIKKDREVVKNIPAGKGFIFLVPPINNSYHVRFFNNKQEIRNRYGDLVDIKTIVEKNKKINPSYRRFLVESTRR
ncbi:unnamed protein product [marine sediment metagenome]|uniref:Methyltransferase type 12 domain-containing protein n=1 Tax=marine sediment metagenome TaxID=412755 RepID=X1AK72_9ZZZZ